MTTSVKNAVAAEIADSKGTCLGTGKPPKKGSRGKRGKVSYRYGYGHSQPMQYECSVCGRRVAKNNSGNLVKHKAETAAEKKKRIAEEKKKLEAEKAALIAQFNAKGMVEGFCAACDKMAFMLEGDYICVECREG